MLSDICGAVNSVNGLLIARSVLFAVLVYRRALLADHKFAKYVYRLCMNMALLICAGLLAAAVYSFVLAAGHDHYKTFSFIILGGMLIYCAWTLYRAHIDCGGRTIVQTVTSVAIKDILLVCVAVTFCLATLELGVRIFYPQTYVRPTGLYIPNKKRIFDLAPNFHGDYRSNGFDVDFTTNSEGLKNAEVKPKTSDTFRVLCVGDSFTMGHGLPTDQSYPQQLEQILRRDHPKSHISVINFGVGGYGPWQELSKMRDDGFRLEPDMVVLQLFPENDVCDELHRVGGRMRSADPEWQSRLDMSEEQLSLGHQWRFFLRRHSEAFLLADNRWRALTQHNIFGHKKTRRYPVIAGRPWWLETSLKEYYPELDEGWRLLEESVRQIRDECRRRGDSIYAFAVPAKYEVSSRMAENAVISTGANPELYDFSKNYRLTIELFRRLDIPYIDLLTPIKNAADPSDLYWKHDAHLNAAGQKLVASCVATCVWQEYSKWMEQRAKPRLTGTGNE
ncbi:MAG: hypothetical protein J7M12_06615 [Candidatus Hydrogenedentes bacterium]|nr:hypothetical protein [Candidatus Hydrogenedentota bacterium]